MKKKLSDYRALARMTMKGNYGTLLLAVLVVIGVQTLVSQTFSSLVTTQSKIMLTAFFLLELLVGFIILRPLEVGTSKFFIDNAAGKTDLKNLFYPFKSNLTNIVKICFVREVKLFLWLMVPWIIGMTILAAASTFIIIKMDMQTAAGLEAAARSIFAQLRGEVLPVTDKETEIFLIVFTVLWVLSVIFMIPGIIKSFEYSMIKFIVAENPDITVKQAFGDTKAMMKGNKLRLFGLYLSFIGWFALGLFAMGIGIIMVIPYVNASLTQFYIDVKHSGVYTESSENTRLEERDTFGI